MTSSLLLPAVAAVVAGCFSGRLQRRLTPRMSVPILAILAATTALAVLGALALFLVGYALRIPWAVANVGWCRHLVPGHAVPVWQGLGAGGALVVMVWRGGRALRRYRRVIALAPDNGPLTVIPSDDPVAYAVPGRPGRVIVSTGMLRCLDRPERRVLLAHEMAHLRHRHHRYLAVGECAAGAVPLLVPLRAQLRYATERWADEDAACEVGDRRLVARAITRAALAQPSVAAMPALASLGVAARVQALLAGPRGAVGWTEVAIAGAMAAAGLSVLSSSVQLHHLLAFAAHLCHL